MPSNRLVIRQALAHFAGVFALAFGVGAARTLWLAPRVGPFAVLLGGSAAGWLGGLATPAGMLGLAGQLGFAGMPWFVWRAGALRG